MFKRGAGVEMDIPLGRVHLRVIIYLYMKHRSYGDGKATFTELRKISRSHTSVLNGVLEELKEYGLVVEIRPNKRKRLFYLTEDGIKLATLVAKLMEKNK